MLPTQMTPNRRIQIWALVLLVGSILLTSCSSSFGTEQGSVAVSKAEAIVCTAAYRADVGTSNLREESLTLLDANDRQSIVFDELTFTAEYASGELDRERTLRTWVTTNTSPDELTTQLYQLPLDAGPQNQFVGGHGFTGLNYIYHPETRAELQFWCEAR